MELKKRKEEAIKFFDECLSTMEGKGEDYSKNDDAFYNFKKIANMLDISVEKVFDFFMACKLARMEALLQGEPNNESVYDSSIDMANYACLKAIYIEESQKN